MTYLYRHYVIHMRPLSEAASGRRINRAAGPGRGDGGAAGAPRVLRAVGAARMRTGLLSGSTWRRSLSGLSSFWPKQTTRVNMSGNRRKNGIPDRWLDYKAVGKRLHGTRFVAFKVPLKQPLNRWLPRPDVFGPWELLDALDREHQELGLIIDLTFTTRYYSLQDVPESLLCLKIFTAGHEVPSDKTILSFKRAVRRFLRDNAENDKLIGVHCTHGLNRTGYLICRYLIDVDGMDPTAAVELFNSSRGHSIERRNYLEDLQRGPKRSNEGMEESEQEPMRGVASHRPSDCDARDERQPQLSDSCDHSRSFPPRETSHRSHHPHPRDGLLPSPALLPPTPFFPPIGARLYHPYQWAPPHPDSPRRRPRYPPAEPEWSPFSRWQEDRRRAPPPPPPFLRYSPHWSSKSRDGAERDWAGPERRHQHRHADRHGDRHGVNTYHY